MLGLDRLGLVLEPFGGWTSSIFGSICLGGGGIDEHQTCITACLYSSEAEEIAQRSKGIRQR